jgi:hypothetical protein
LTIEFIFTILISSRRFRYLLVGRIVAWPGCCHVTIQHTQSTFEETQIMKMPAKIFITVVTILCLAIVMSISVSGCVKSGKSLKEQLAVAFVSPPDSCRPGVYWYFMDGNISREGMTADLEAMKAAGIASVLFLEVNVGVPRGNVQFMSDEWISLFKHARSECERLGITMKLGLGPGWTGSGGPWVKPEQSMQHLVSSIAEVAGPGRVAVKLPRPKPKQPFFGEGAFTPELKKEWNSFYKDVSVLAYRAPAARSFVRNANIKSTKLHYGGLHATQSYIDDFEEKALYYRSPYSSYPGVKRFIPAPAENNAAAKDIVLDRKSLIDLTAFLQPDGTLVWDAPPGRWVIMRFGSTNNGSVTRPAPLPGVGLECDKFDTAAFNVHFENFVKKLLPETITPYDEKRGGITTLHMDSWEMTAQNWSANFRREFQKRRGYDPLPFFPAYSGIIVGSLEESERFLWDLRLTAKELVLENHAEHVKDLCRRFGLQLSIEPYDMNPTADLDLGAVADVPMCEFWHKDFGFNTSFSCIEAASIAHVLGKPVVASESFTSTGGFHSYPGSLKNQGDWAFGIGVNMFYYHTFAHKPFPDRYRPGMTMGPYGVHWDRAEPWWPMSSAYHRYIARCSFLLQQGRTPADVVYLTAEGAPHVFVPPPSAVGTKILPDRRGYNFDGCSPDMLMAGASVVDKQLVFKSGARYRLLVLPAFETMTPKLLQKLQSLVAAGAILVGGPPVKSPSLSDFPDCDSLVRSIAEKMWGSLTPPASVNRRTYGKGEIYWGGELARQDSGSLYPCYQATERILVQLGARRDFESAAPLRYAHRTMDDLDLYFVANTADSTLDAECWFNVPQGAPELWNPVTGEMSALHNVRLSGERMAIRMAFAPYQSYFVVVDRTRGLHGADGTAGSDFPQHQVLKRVEGPWRVSFDTTWGGPASVSFSTLQDWTTRKEDGIRYYSGTATYHAAFELPESLPPALALDLGEVHCIARVKVNGTDLGVVWCAPWQVDMSEVAKVGRNDLEIEVANLWVNRLVGDEYLPDDGVKDGKFPEWLLTGAPRTSGRYTFCPVKYYDATSPLQKSGLVGPVTIQSLSSARTRP